MNELTTDQKWFFSPGALNLEQLTVELRELANRLMAESSGRAPGILVATASEILDKDTRIFPDWATDHDTRHLVVLDVPVAAAMRLPSALGMRKPEQRMHLTADPAAVRRLVIAQARSEAIEGLVDAYCLASTLVLILGDLSVRELATEKLPVLNGVYEVADFRIDVDGSFLEWPEHDLHLDTAGLLKEVDPDYQARLEIERLLNDLTGDALAQMRERARLRQTDIPGLSSRHVRRIEKGISRLTLDAARNFAVAFGLDLASFLDRLAKHVGELRGRKAEEGEVATVA